MISVLKKTIANLLIGDQIYKNEIIENFRKFYDQSYYQNDLHNFISKEDSKKILNYQSINDENDHFFHNSDLSNEHKNFIDNHKNKVIVNKGYGTLQTILNDQNNFDFFTNILNQITPIKKILDVYKNPKLTTIKIERKRQTVIKKWSQYEFNSVHLDGYHLSLKLYIYLNDVDNTKGPFKIYKGTANWENYLKLAYQIKRFKKRYFNRSDVNPYKNSLETLLGKQCSFFIFSGNALHSASNVNSGFRDTIQLYFDSNNDNWYSKK